MKLFIYFIGLIEIFLNISSETKNYYFTIVDNIYYYDFIINYFIFIEVLPELLLLLFIFYSLINMFNDKNSSIFQYYKWLFYFIFIFSVLVFKFVGFEYFIADLFFGFTWINSYFTKVSKLFILGLTLLVLLISEGKIKYFSKLNYFLEFPLIIGFSVLFMFLLLSSYDFFGVYLTIEGLSLTLYVLSTMLHQGIVSVEASIKYFSLGAIASGCLLFGIVLFFAVVGSLDFLEVQNFLGSQVALNYIFEIKISITLILFAFFFKISAFPCHVWVADIYEGVWSPITAFFAIVVKSCLILFFIRLLFDVFFNVLTFFQPIFIVVSIGSIIVGSFGALKQVRIKRFLAYTSITQVGFILLGAVSGSLLGLLASIMYLFLYVLMNLIFFSIFLNIEHIIFRKNIVYLSDLYSLSLYNKEIAQHLSLTILSMAGLPPLGGFVGKLFLYFAVIEAHLDFVLIISLLISLVSTYYYLNFVRYLFFEKRVEIKLYYYIKKTELIIFLRFFSILLVTFLIFLNVYIDFFLRLSFSCLWPFLFF
jgi:NADH-quinone oxidoreductase subunit N